MIKVGDVYVHPEGHSLMILDIYGDKVSIIRIFTNVLDQDYYQDVGEFEMYGVIRLDTQEKDWKKL